MFQNHVVALFGDSIKLRCVVHSSFHAVSFWCWVFCDRLGGILTASIWMMWLRLHSRLLFSKGVPLSDFLHGVWPVLQYGLNRIPCRIIIKGHQTTTSSNGSFQWTAYIGVHKLLYISALWCFIRSKGLLNWPAHYVALTIALRFHYQHSGKCG